MVPGPNSTDTSVVTIGIAGGTGSGKTTVAQKIVEQLPEQDCSVIQHDWYYKDHVDLGFDELKKLNFDEPAALDNELLVDHIRSLREGKDIEAPQYDFSTHRRKEETLTVKARRIIVVEGILLFAIPALRDLFDLRVFVHTDDDIRLMRRIKRDILTRGRDIKSIQEQYYNTVRPMHQLHVAPSRQHAHLIVPEGGQNRQAVDVIAGRLRYFLLGDLGS